MISFALIDWIIVIVCLLAFTVIGIYSSRSAGKSSADFFLSGRQMPWWMLGVSMVATTFSADTPNLVADIVRRNGVSGNWEWWAFLLTGMLTVFVYAKLWRRAGILTDLEFYTLRYSGKEADWLRAFRAVYLGLFFNAIIMATVILAAIKIGGAMLGLSPWQTVALASVITVIYSTAGGLKGVVLTDLLQFGLAMTGAIGAAIVILRMPEVDGLSNLITHEQVSGKLNLLPDFSDPTTLVPLFLIPLAVQWWSAWYPGAEPGGGGYIAQRILATRTEKGAMSATLLFNVAHYALRPWPWILVALASLIVFPIVPDPGAEAGTIAARGLQPLADAFPNLPEDKIGHDLAYPAMLRNLPGGLLGIVLVSLMAAFMSTISTHLNWGSSYIVNDFYKPHINPDASERKLVRAGRISTVVLMIISILFAFYLENALDSFRILLQIGAGTGLIYILRWFWYRINVWSEITAMIVSFVLALYFERGHESLGFEEIPGYLRYLWGVGLTSMAWITVTFLTKPADMDALASFYQRIRPHSTGWKPVIHFIQGSGHSLPSISSNSLGFEIGAMVVACFTVYGILFTTGYLIYGQWLAAGVSGLIAILGIFILAQWWPKFKFK